MFQGPFQSWVKGYKMIKKIKKGKIKKTGFIKEILKRNVGETSKLVLLSLIVFCVAVSAVILIGWMLGREGAVDLFRWIISLLIFITSFYTWKAKSENVEKIKKNGILSDAMIDKLIERYGEDLAYMGINIQESPKGTKQDNDAVG